MREGWLGETARESNGSSLDNPKEKLGNRQQKQEESWRGMKFRSPLEPGQSRGKALMLKESLGSSQGWLLKNKFHCFESVPMCGGIPQKIGISIQDPKIPLHI